MRRNRFLASFTLVEMLTVIGIIAILAAISLAAGSSLISYGKRSRATNEIQALGTALEGYKTDNALYPQATTLTTNTYMSSDGTGTAYQTASEALYLALSGQTNFTATPVVGVKSYFAFKQNQVGTVANVSYVQDPWGYSYGYSTGSASGSTTTNYPYNGSGFYDLWSTGGALQATSTASAFTNSWIANWK